ncbi:solute carrier organic anion transporter family member 6A1 [Nannospalax galili]|uniref:solute carrier organic anion transporter family member 6A1 n=1 Tax=Nannospalax galili TaxID=1026970 RepID=UPI0004ED5384|nr:solute carrier organic anion transporter family member 6A1 [Nannospalax galili]
MLGDLMQRVKGVKVAPLEEQKDDKQQQDPKEKEHRESEGSRKIGPSLTTFPTAMMEFTSLQRRKRSDPASSNRASGPRQNTILEGPYGLGRLVFPALQRLNNIRFFMVLYCFLVLSQGIMFGLVDLSTGHLEKNYYLSKTEKLALSFTYDISSFVVVIFVAHYGGRGSRTKWMAFSSFMIGLGAISYTVPYLTSEISKPHENDEEICQETRLKDACRRNRSAFISKYLIFVLLGETLQGVGGMPIYILGTTFIDDSVPTHSSGIYLGLGEASEILGYGLGYAAGAPQLKASTNHLSNVNNNMLLWPVSWLITFIISSILAWCTFIPFLFFPHSLPGTHSLKIEKDKQPHPFDKKLKDKEFGYSLKDLYSAFSILVHNPLLMFQAICKAIESLAFIGASEFLPKYLENQFLLTPSMATMLTGVILIPAGAIGYFLGGLIVCKLEMSFKGLMRFTLVTSTISLILLILVMFVHCETEKFAGINEDYEGTGQLGNFTAPCNEHCSCTSSVYSSVCGRDEVEYFSPCFAGCIASKVINNAKAYYNCSCIQEGLTTSDEEGDFVDALPGKCNTKCYKLPLFFAFFFSSITFSSLSGIPITLTVLRSVPDKLRSMAMGVTYVTLRLLGTIPGPLIFKLTADSSCTYWDINPCGVKGHCWIYNKSKMVYILMGICFFCKVCTVIFTTWALSKYDDLTKESVESLSMPVGNIKASKGGKK